MTLAWTGSSTPVGGEEATTMNSIAGSGCSLGGGGGGGGVTVSIRMSGNIDLL